MKQDKKKGMDSHVGLCPPQNDTRRNHNSLLLQ